MARPRPNTNITITVPDIGQLLQQATERYKAAGRPNAERVTGFRTVSGLGFASTKNGDLYCLDRDGYGPAEPITDENPLQLNLYPEFSAGEDGSFPIAMEPGFTARLRKTEILKFPVKEQNDLSEFIRTFGRRLEENFALWAEQLSK